MVDVVVEADKLPVDKGEHRVRRVRLHDNTSILYLAVQWF